MDGLPFFLARQIGSGGTRILVGRDCELGRIRGDADQWPLVGLSPRPVTLRWRRPGPRAAMADGDLCPRRTVARHRTRMNSKAPIHFLSNSPDRALHFTDSSNSSISMKQDNLVQENQARIRVNIAAISIWTNPNKDMVLPKQDPTT